MRVSSLLKLPFALLISSLALSAPVESAELLVLTPETFKDTIATGVWFVEHFSPYCGHCRNFAPTWQKLDQDNKQSPDPGIHLAQVNCAVHGDLCKDNGVDGYPQMNLYRNGEYVETYKKPRSFEQLTAYLAKHAEPSTPPPVIQENPREEEPVPPAIVNPSGTVLVLDETSFPQVVAQGPIFIKFFAPWCGHCKKLAPTWVQLAAAMQNKLTIAEVNCDDHPALCKQEDIQGYPMLNFYTKPGVKTEYTGGRKLDLMKAFAERAASPGIQELSFEDYSRTLMQSSVFYLLLHSSSDSYVVNQVTQASSILFGSPPIYTSTSPSFFTHFNIPPSSSPVLLSIKDHDDSTPAAIYRPTAARDINVKEGIREWLLANRLPTSLELSSDTFQTVMNAPHNPLVVIVALPNSLKDEVVPSIEEIGRMWRLRKGADGREERSVVFTWMDSEKWQKWLKSMYGVKSSEENLSIVISDHQKLLYWDVDQSGQKIQLTSDSVFSAIDGIRTRKISGRHSENFVERLARYLNDMLTGVEVYVIAHPWRTGGFALVALVLFILLMKRLFSDDFSDVRDFSRDPSMRKSHRLD
ncbi:hypothetical protein JAAARDRAFT_43901 [Jaapia argillacea MUCL 33604]|uniref:Thioredoxin domain-containing protein n=1 Tax=Jaapia argillacea MUCL 33604 TaxID=933084 RepID=A0A067QDJ7_9AGAM|nr:hypothetical protein JAAARDRAFT_43901 [Jaapia argillacea MUCL 33604]